MHAELTRRAERVVTSLRAYVVRVLEDHCVTPTVDEWLDSLPISGQVGSALSTVDALAQARDDDDRTSSR